MKNSVEETLSDLLVQWETNQQTSILEDAEEAATLLEYRFYTFIAALRDWFESIPKPKTLEESLSLPTIQYIVGKLPAPLYIPFENELELLVDGIHQENDEKYD